VSASQGGGWSASLESHQGLTCSGAECAPLRPRAGCHSTLCSWLLWVALQRHVSLDEPQWALNLEALERAVSLRTKAIIVNRCACGTKASVSHRCDTPYTGPLSLPAFRLPPPRRPPPPIPFLLLGRLLWAPPDLPPCDPALRAPRCRAVLCSWWARGVLGCSPCNPTGKSSPGRN